ncbi:MAG TPA: rRNA pseudouridine synthase [Tissierellia bacterium]|nr:rRNA pseudouridine synthase [Tissierellia bacterium]
MRLQKYLAQAGVASRRKAEELIAAGEIKINGRVHQEMGYIVKPNDRVTYQGKVVEPIKRSEHEYWAFFKPGGIVSTVSDPEGRKTIMAFYKGDQRVYPVGRLDYDSEGLMILTTDGDYAHQMMHPKFEKKKVYLALLSRDLTDRETSQLRRGVMIDDYKTRPIGLTKLVEGLYQVELKEGRNRQIRKMMETIDVEVERLRRIRFGKVQLGNLKPGQMRPLTKDELR